MGESRCAFCQARSSLSVGQSLGVIAHDAALNAFMTLPPYTGTREGEARQLAWPLHEEIPSIWLSLFCNQCLAMQGGRLLF